MIRRLTECLFMSVLMAFIPTSSSAQEYVNVEYLCADWGPAMRLSTKTNEPPQFSDTEAEIYFLKQVGRFTRKTTSPDPFSGKTTQDVGKGISIYLCKMKPDGSGKTEIKELWRNPNFPIDTQQQSSWMDVNEKTRKIALSITYAGNQITGLWTMNLDGSELKRIITPEQNERYLQAINHPSWMPDGQWIVFEEELRGMNPNRFNIAKCDAKGQRFIRLIEATDKPQYMQPSVSPDGKQTVFAKYPDGYPGQRWVWLAESDGSNARPLGGKQTVSTWGDWPAWSPDGKKILFKGVTGTIADEVTGKLLLAGQPMCQSKPYTFGWAHWGRVGIVGYTVGGILLTDSELNEAKYLGESLAKRCTNNHELECRW